MDFFDRELGREWRERLRDPEFWSALERVPDERYWATAQEVKARMLASVRERLQREYERKGLSPAQLRHVTRFLDPQRPGVLTLGLRGASPPTNARRCCCATARASRGWSTIPSARGAAVRRQGAPCG